MKYVSLLLLFILLIPGLATAQVKINEVLYATAEDQVELKNFGTTSVDVSDWWLCALLVYDRLGTLNVESGSLNIPPGGILVVSGKSLNDNSSDLGLYNSGADFTNPDLMEDFVQWGVDGPPAFGRENVAVSKGIWTEDDFVPTVAAGHSIEYDGDGNASTDWGDQANPTLGEENGNITSIDEGTSVPEGFSLAQNYPNPFNPTTTIDYTIPQAANLTQVRLDIYNALGQKVRALVNEQRPAGSYSVVWDGRDESGEVLPSGFYMYRLEVGELVSTRKMLLLK